MKALAKSFVDFWVIGSLHILFNCYVAMVCAYYIIMILQYFGFQAPHLIDL